MKKYHAVLFDLDGTLVDTAADFIPVVNGMREKRNMPPLPDASIRKTVSNGARALVKLGLAISEQDTEFDNAVEELKKAYAAGGYRHAKLYSGFAEILKAFSKSNTPWGIVTNKPSEFTLPLVKGLALADAPACIICPDHVTHSKPHPEPLFLACSQISCTPEKTLYVGDHLRDIEAGKNAGMETVAVSWGYIEDGDNAANWGADYLIHTPEELMSLL